MTITFSMSGIPRSKGRPRATVRGSFASIYTDADTRKYEASVGKIGKAAMTGRQPFTGALSVSLRFRFEPAASLSKRAKAALLSGEAPYIGVKDLDNLAKAVLDGLNAVCFVDDRQITRLFVTKVAAEKAGVDVRIEPLEPQQEQTHE